MEGYILLHRSMLDWEWYQDQNTKAVFLHLLLTANFKDRPWRGTVIRRGQRVCSLNTLSEETRLSIQNIRTALAHLKATGEITCKAGPQYTVVTVTGYDRYQQPGGRVASGQHAGNTAAAGWQHQEKKDKQETQQRKTGGRGIERTRGLERFNNPI